MLPQNNNHPSGKIYVNPNFKGPIYQGRKPNVSERVGAPTTTNIPVTAHINPLFLKKAKVNDAMPKIHMNPMFLLKLRERQRQEEMMAKATSMVTNIANAYSFVTAAHHVPLPQPASPVGACSITKKITTPLSPTENRKIICKSKNRLIRESARPSLMKRSPLANSPKIQPQKLMLINKRKLIRKPALSLEIKPNPIKALNVPVLGEPDKTKYKLDNRVIRRKTPMKTKRKSFVGRYALRRTSSNQTPTKPNVIKSNKSQSNNKTLQLLNINGLLYNSTRNKLQLKDTVERNESRVTKPTKPASSITPKSSQGLTIFVQGTKYVMDAQKLKLTRVPNTEIVSSPSGVSKSSSRSRIDVGGFTYVSSPLAKNVLIRSRTHLARAYVHNAKQKSVHVLTKHLVKSNIPCPIYQRLGKCAAYERGKCSNVHDRQQIAICSKFLRGECFHSNCLLSHDVSMSKMPVCKFFLQGVCIRNDCPYLHKKLSNNAEVCIDFLRGFCKLAEKCKKRHEFVCPELERTGFCAIKSCLFCKSKKKKEQMAKAQQIKEAQKRATSNKNETTEAVPTTEAITVKRYFVAPTAEETKGNDCQEDVKEERSEDIIAEDITTMQETGLKKRPKLGVLPAFIPLS